MQRDLNCWSWILGGLILAGCTGRDLPAQHNEEGAGAGECAPGETRACECYEPPTSGAYLGIGTQTCDDEGFWGDCTMCVLPTDEGGDGDGDGDGASAGDGDGDGDGDGEYEWDPDCFDATQEGDWYYPVESQRCGLELNCPSVGLISSEFDNPDYITCSNAVYDPLEAACVIEALRQGVPGAYGLEDCPGGQYHRDRILEVFDDGAVLYQNYHGADLGHTQRETLRMLPDAAYFDACSVATPEDFIACIDGIVDEECLPGPVACP